MDSDLVEQIIQQFFHFVKKLAKKCNIKWNKCELKIVSRQYVDAYIIEIFKHTYQKSFWLPLPIVIIYFTDINNKNLHDENWKKYLRMKASDLLNRLALSNKNIIISKCCPDLEKHEPPKNKCDCVYHKEYFLCPQKKCKIEKPYDEWGKHCKCIRRGCECKEIKKCEHKEEKKCSCQIVKDHKHDKNKYWVLKEVKPEKKTCHKKQKPHKRHHKLNKICKDIDKVVSDIKNIDDY